MTEPSPPEPVADDAALTDELYARPPGEFVARRDELAARVRADGDRARAARIKALRRPSIGAWYLNTAVRAGLDPLAALLRLGDQLREALTAGDIVELRDLAARRGPLTADVVRELGVLLRARGATATPAGLDEVRATLAGALADPSIAAEVQTGRLDGPRAYSGFGDLLLAPPAPATSADRPGPDASATGGDPATGAADPAPDEAERAVQAERARRRDAARRDLAVAEAAASAVATRRSELAAEVGEARARVAELTGRLTAARHELAVAEAELADAANEERAAADRVAEAQRRLWS